MLRNLRCKLGFHQWEWQDHTDELGIYSFCRCTNLQCSLNYWMQVHYEARKPW